MNTGYQHAMHWRQRAIDADGETRVAQAAAPVLVVVEELVRFLMDRLALVPDQVAVRPNRNPLLSDLASRRKSDAIAELLPLDSTSSHEAGCVAAAVLRNGRIAIAWNATDRPVVYGLNDDRLLPHLVVLRDRLRHTVAQMGTAPAR